TEKERAFHCPRGTGEQDDPKIRAVNASSEQKHFVNR
ncbi:hypothetical protein, partial [Bacillus phage SPG24]